MEGAGEECMFLCAVIVQVWHWTWVLTRDFNAGRGGGCTLLHSEGGGGGVIIITDLLFVPVHFLQTHCCMGIVTQRMTMAVRVHDECEIFVLYFANEDQSLYII